MNLLEETLNYLQRELLMSRSKKRRHEQYGDPEDNNKIEPTFYGRKQPKRLQAQTEAQGQYISNILTKDITFGVGPAGTGKTYIAASLAAEALMDNKINSIVVCRPMNGCDEDMGFFPGTITEKYEPWMEPIIDVLEYKLGKSQVHMYLKNGKISAKPLMTMRGKTHRDSWVILDEAQNTTPKQMKMFITRIGEGSKVIIDGDLEQSDLVDRRGDPIENGLADAINRLRRLPEVGLVTFEEEDIVRHGLIRKILQAYR